jgi:hypothetical protein
MGGGEGGGSLPYQGPPLPMPLLMDTLLFWAYLILDIKKKICKKYNSYSKNSEKKEWDPTFKRSAACYLNGGHLADLGAQRLRHPLRLIRERHRVAVASALLPGQLPQLQLHVQPLVDLRQGLLTGLAIKNPPKKNHPKNPKKTHLKKPTKNVFFFFFFF